MQSYPEAIFLLSVEHQHRLRGDPELGRHRAEANRVRRPGWWRRGRGKYAGAPHHSAAQSAAQSGASCPAPEPADISAAPPIASAPDQAAATLASCAPGGGRGQAVANAAQAR